MSRRLAFLSVVLASAAAAARAEEPARHTLPVHDVWKAGDVSSAKGSQKTTQKVSVKGEDGSPLPGGKESDDAVEFEVVAKVLEVDAKGRATKSQVHFASWSRKAGAETDTSLSGANAEVTGLGSARAVKVVDAPTPPSAGAAGWLEQQFGSKAGEREERREALVPEKPVAVGESWDVDTAKLVAMFSNPNQKYLPEKSTGKVTLVSVQDGIAELRFEASLQSAALPTPMGPLDWSEGGVMAVDARFTRPIDPARHESRGSTNVRWSGKATPPGATVEVDVRSEQTGSMKPGGEMPAPKPAETGK